jgi:ubiquinone/menaquinone biosynthesis C-methylase UbiE
MAVDMSTAPYLFNNAAGYERYMARWSRTVGEEFLDWLAPPRGARWLDVGCGTGAFTALIVDRCEPQRVAAVDPAQAQVDHAREKPVAAHADFRVADAQALPFDAAQFDVVAAALTLNFIPDRTKAMAEMRRVARPGGLIAAYVWDFEADLSPSGPLRRALRSVGVDTAPVPGTQSSGMRALRTLFLDAGLEDVVSRIIDVTMPFPDFEAFWHAQALSYGPLAKTIDALPEETLEKVRETMRGDLVPRSDGTFDCHARAHAILGRAPA